MASMTILLKIRTQRPDAFFQTRTTKKGIGRHRHDKDPGNRDPQGRISEIPYITQPSGRRSSESLNR